MSSYERKKTIPGVSPICTMCTHFDSDNPLARRCVAFSENIPMEIWLGKNDHGEPFTGDHGIRFEALSKEELKRKLAQV